MAKYCCRVCVCVCNTHIHTPQNLGLERDKHMYSRKAAPTNSEVSNSLSSPGACALLNPCAQGCGGSRGGEEVGGGGRRGGAKGMDTGDKETEETDGNDAEAPCVRELKQAVRGALVKRQQLLNDEYSFLESGKGILDYFQAIAKAGVVQASGVSPEEAHGWGGEREFIRIETPEQGQEKTRRATRKKSELALDNEAQEFVDSVEKRLKQKKNSRATNKQARQITLRQLKWQQFLAASKRVRFGQTQFQPPEKNCDSSGECGSGVGGPEEGGISGAEMREKGEREKGKGGKLEREEGREGRRAGDNSGNKDPTDDIAGEVR
jgi:hypothetical protein